MFVPYERLEKKRSISDEKLSVYDFLQEKQE